MRIETLDKDLWSLASDIYSLALVFFEIITLKIPLSDYKDGRVAAMILKNKKDEIPDEVPSNLKSLMEAMRNSNYKSRPTAPQILAKLKEFENSTDFQDLQIAPGIRISLVDKLRAEVTYIV